jgi:hypothetical protein
MTHVRKLMLKPRWNAEPVECMVEVELDLDRIAAGLGAQALRNKSKRSRYLSGLIKVEVRPVRSV